MIKNFQLGARIILGLIYFIFGGMGLAMAFGLMQMPETPPMQAAAVGFMQGMMGTGYFIPFLKLTETSCGILLLIGLAAPLSLIILAPITLQIILFHAFLTPNLSELILPLFMGILHTIAMSSYWGKYKPLYLK